MIIRFFNDDTTFAYVELPRNISMQELWALDKLTQEKKVSFQVVRVSRSFNETSQVHDWIKEVFKE